jgi:hypothetical protein
MLMRELKSFDPEGIKATKVNLDDVILDFAKMRQITSQDNNALFLNAANNDAYSHLFAPKREAFMDMLAFELEAYAQGGWSMLSAADLMRARDEYLKETDLKLNDLAFVA